MVVGVRFASSLITQGVSEIVAGALLLPRRLADMAFFADFWVLILFALLIPVAIHRQGEKRRERFEDRDN